MQEKIFFQRFYIEKKAYGLIHLHRMFHTDIY